MSCKSLTVTPQDWQERKNVIFTSQCWPGLILYCSIGFKSKQNVVRAKKQHAVWVPIPMFWFRPDLELLSVFPLRVSLPPPGSLPAAVAEQEVSWLYDAMSSGESSEEPWGTSVRSWGTSRASLPLWSRLWWSCWGRRSLTTFWQLFLSS